MWNSSDGASPGAGPAGTIAAATILGRLAGELRRSRSGLLALEGSIGVAARTVRDPDILRALQGLDLLGQELDAYAGLCDRLGDGLPGATGVDGARLIAPVTLDAVRDGILGRAAAEPAPAGEADLF